ncbi:MAG: hypothetical protein CTY18_03025 [Methylomonas sp.]|nr:MAG: hypothetical protein CTY18_03025 [Methylomonas sp.]
MSDLTTMQQQLEATEQWATGIFLVIEQLMPFLIQGHPRLDKIESLLKQSRIRFDQLTANPEQAQDSEAAGIYEAGKILFDQMALLGLWPVTAPK